MKRDNRKINQSAKSNLDTDQKHNKEYSILIRYVILFVLIFVFQAELFNKILEMVFNFFAYYFLNLFTVTVLLDGVLYINNEYVFLIVKECLAASAYIFIATILLTMPVKLKLNFSMLYKALIVFTVVNLVRILLLMWIHLFFGENTFNSVHLIFYEGVSGIIVALIIIYFLRKNKIRKIYPVLDDIKYLISLYKK